MLVIDAVTVTSAAFGHAQHLTVLQIPNYLLYGALGDSYLSGHVTQTGLRVPRKTDQDMAVIAEQGPMAQFMYYLDFVLGELYFVFKFSAISFES